jgi:hypothetical protein
MIMRPSLRNTFLPLAFGALLLSACEAEPLDGELLTDEEIAASESAITGANLTVEAPWVVRLDLPNGMCSGSVLTEHYILTAGHCVKGYANNHVSSMTVRWANTLGGAQALYTGQAWFYKNPKYKENDWWPDAGEDVALIRLGGSGVNTNLTGKAKLWGWNYPNVNYEPWEQSSQNRWFTLIGWGRTDPSGDSKCVSGTAGQKRIGYGFKVDVTDQDENELHAPINHTHACGGDSGTPWLIVRGGQLIAFAVHSGRMSDLIIAGDYHKGASIKEKRNWLYEATKHSGLKLICAGAGFAGDSTAGVTYEMCNEQVHNPTPPPGPACPSGQHCCEPISSTECGMCIDNDKECP